MTLADERLRELDNPSLTEDERIGLRCAIAADLMHAGQYEAAREALGELWRGVGERPDVKKLPPVTAAEVLLQYGTLTGLLGHARNVAGAQEKAQDLLTEAAIRPDAAVALVRIDPKQAKTVVPHLVKDLLGEDEKQRQAAVLAVDEAGRWAAMDPAHPTARLRRVWGGASAREAHPARSGPWPSRPASGRGHVARVGRSSG